MIVGVTGLIATGKDTVAKFLEEKGFKRLSLSDDIRTELEKRGKTPTRKNEREMGNALRKRYGEGVLAKRAIERMEQGEDYVVVSIRNPGEVEELRKLEDFTLVKVDASDKKRFELMQKERMGKDKYGDTDSWEEFVKMNKEEMENEDPKKQQLKKVIGMADHEIKNDGTREELREKTINFINSISS